jgi:hypothetical protein
MLLPGANPVPETARASFLQPLPRGEGLNGCSLWLAGLLPLPSRVHDAVN